jgi:hypothetical protein
MRWLVEYRDHGCTQYFVADAADDAAHATEQTLNAYPTAQVAQVWACLDAPPFALGWYVQDSVLGAVLLALHDRGVSARWCAAVAETLDEDTVWNEVLGPLLDRMQQGWYHQAGVDTTNKER